MPHKRAKRSVRDAERAKAGYNLAPSKGAGNDDMPRGAMRILNAGKVQAAFRASGKRSSEDTGERRPRGDGGDDDKPRKKAKTDAGDKGKSGLPKIGTNESLGEYNRRIEALLRPGVSGAIKKAEAARGAAARAAEDAKKERIAKAQGKKLPSPSPSPEPEIRTNKPQKEFAELPQRRRLNDVAQAPPSLPRLKAADKAAKKGAKATTTRDPLNAGQRRIMDEERERVVRMYRELKAKKEAERQPK